MSMFLHQIGEVLCRYEVEKRCAVDMEDYDSARQKKASSFSLFLSQSPFIPRLEFPHTVLNLAILVCKLIKVKMG